MQIVETQVRIPQTKTGKQWIVLAEEAVRGDMNEPRPGAVLAQRLDGGVFTEQKTRLRQSARCGLRFLADGGGQSVGDAEDERTAGRVHGFAAAQREDTRVRSVGDGETLREVALAVVEGMEREVVQQSVRDDDELLAVEPLAERKDELVVQLAQMSLRGAQQLITETLDVVCAELELGHLELEQADQIGDTRVQ